MKIAVTGAAGYVGGAVVRALLGRGHEVAALARRADAPLDPRARRVTGDVRDPAAVGRLLDGAAAVVHAAAWVHRAAGGAAARAECFSVNVGGAREVVATLARDPGRFLALVSSTAVYGAPVEGAREDAPVRPGTAYGRSKAEAERVVLEAAGTGAVRACVLRPAFVYGTGAPGNSGRLLALVRRGVVPMVRGGNNRKSLVHVDDLADVLARAVEAGAVVDGRTYNVAGPALSVREMAEALAEGLGAPLRTAWFPAWPWTAAAAASRLAHRLSGGRIPDLGRSLEVFTETSTVDASAVARDLGALFRDPRRGLADTARAAGAV